MSEKREFDDIMLGGDDMRGKDSKKMLLLIIAIVVLLLAIVIIVMAMSGKTDSVSGKKDNEPIVVNTQPTGIGESAIPGDEFKTDFNSMNIDNSNEDRFDQIVRDIKNSTEPEPLAPEPLAQPEPKATIPNKPTNVAPKPKVTQRTTTRRTMNRLNNGDLAENGYYLQVGAFSKTPNRAFIDSINNYSYRIQEIMINSIVITRYLVGPYKSREEAQRDYDRVSRDIATKPVYLLVQ